MSIRVGPADGKLRMWCTKCDRNILLRDKAVRSLTITDLAAKHERQCPLWYVKVSA
jgi:hypothetical protein